VEIDTSLDSILQHLRAMLPDLRERHGVQTLEVFGSRTRSDSTDESDLDLLVTFETTPGLLGFIRLENELGDRLGIPVDLVMRRSLKPHLRERIQAEAVPV
jgi:uncharacterized protein